MEKIIEINYNGEDLDVDVHYKVANSNTLLDVSTGYTPTKGDCIYLMPGVNIPRVKLKDLALSQGITVVRNPEKANIIITGKATINKICTGVWKYYFKTADIVEFINDSTLDLYYKEKLHDAVLAAPTCDTIITSYGCKRILAEDDSIKCLNPNSSEHIVLVDADYVEILDAIQGKPMYPESELLAMLNGDDAVVIGEEVYEQLSQMFQSSDQDNHIMAMEIMANSKYEESALYLLLLLEGYSHKILDCNTKNHVNFKSLLSYFEITNRNVDNLDANDISNNLIKLGLLTEEWLHVLFIHRSDWILRNISYSQIFSISQVTVKPDILQAIGTEYTASIETDIDTKKVSITNLNTAIIPIEREVEHEEEERVMQEPVTDELIEIALTNINRKELKLQLIELEESKEDLSNELPAPPEEIILDISEPILNTNLIEETNESTDIDWF